MKSYVTHLTLTHRLAVTQTEYRCWTDSDWFYYTCMLQLTGPMRALEAVCFCLRI